MAPSTPTQTHPQRLLAPDLARGFMLLLIAMAYAGVYVGAAFGTDASDEPPPRTPAADQHFWNSAPGAVP